MKSYITLSNEGVQTLLEYAKSMKTIYKQYCEAGEKLRHVITANCDNMGDDADGAKALLNKFEYQVRCNSDALHNMYLYCLKEAQYLSILLNGQIGGAVPDMPYSQITAHQKLTAYMTSHKYGPDDAQTYMNDPEWQRLSAAAKKEGEQGRHLPKEFRSLNDFKGKVSGENLTYAVENLNIVLEEAINLADSDDVAKRNAMTLGEEQGYLELPKLVSKKDFEQAVKTSGVYLCRGLRDGIDVISHEPKSATDFKQSFINSHQFVYNAGGGMRFGPGIYMAGNSYPRAYIEPSVADVKMVEDEARMYGDTLIKMTLDPYAKVISGWELRNEYDKLVANGNDVYGDENVYAIAMGYDGVKNERAGMDHADYYTIFNRSALIILDD